MGLIQSFVDANEWPKGMCLSALGRPSPLSCGSAALIPERLPFLAVEMSLTLHKYLKKPNITSEGSLTFPMSRQSSKEETGRAGKQKPGHALRSIRVCLSVVCMCSCARVI